MLITSTRNTYGETIIMGRRTWDSLGRKKLKGRRNVVVSRKKVPCVETLVHLDNITKYDNPWVIGGANLCEQLWQIGDILYLTRVHTTVPNGLDIRLPRLRCLWSRTFDSYTFSINRITGI